jgi:hypothetical protein
VDSAGTGVPRNLPDRADHKENPSRVEIMAGRVAHSIAHSVSGVVMLLILDSPRLSHSTCSPPERDLPNLKGSPYGARPQDFWMK